MPISRSIISRKAEKLIYVKKATPDLSSSNIRRWTASRATSQPYGIQKAAIAKLQYRYLSHGINRQKTTGFFYISRLIIHSHITSTYSTKHSEETEVGNYIDKETAVIKTLFNKHDYPALTLLFTQAAENTNKIGT